MTISIEQRNVYGNNVYYVIDESARAIAKLTGKKTISISDMAALEQLGVHCQILQTFVPFTSNARL